MSLRESSRLGPYEVLGPLGAGGMGEVYRARDTRLGREVALKVLRDQLAANPAALARFTREAKAVAAVSHPNILALYDVGDEGGVAYAVTELLEGETLRERLASGALPRKKALELAIQMAAGLAAAHEKGIVHRDLKPENVFVTRDGRVKLLDFGLARQEAVREEAGAPEDTKLPTLRIEDHPDRTRDGTVVGTVGYMSPEQVRGEPADARSDVFAFGAVLFEMLTGRRAFRSATPAETMAAILREDPPASPELRGDTLARTVERCLEKDPRARFQLARELLFALELSLTPAPDAAASTRRSIAVLPFKDLTRDPESAFLGVGLADATITELSLLSSLLVRPTAAILKYGEGAADARQAGRELEVDAVVAGSFQRAGQRLRVTVQLVETRDGATLWGSKIDTSLEDVFRMQDEVSRAIAQALHVELTASDEKRLSRAASPQERFHELYLKGRFLLLNDTLEDTNTALEVFETLVRESPRSALACAGLCDAFVRMAVSYEPHGDWYEKAEAMSRRALELDPNLPEGRYLKGRLLWTPRGGFHHAGAIRELTAALAGNPNMVEARQRLGIVLQHVSLLAESEAELERALAINPDDAGSVAHIGLARLFAGHIAEAITFTRRSLERAPSLWAHYQLAHCHLRNGEPGEAERLTEVALRRYPADVLSHPVLGLLAAARGDRTAARRQIDLTIQNARAYGHYHHAQVDVAAIHATLGEKDEAMSWLADGARNGFPCHVFFRTDPLLAPLRGDTRFETLMAELEAESRRCLDAYRERGSGESEARAR